MTAPLAREQRELADFIRAGSSRGPQCFGSYFDEHGGSCALGAVYEGVYHLPRGHGRLVPNACSAVSTRSPGRVPPDVRNVCRWRR
jgi:hypothetical protein